MRRILIFAVALSLCASYLAPIPADAMAGTQSGSIIKGQSYTTVYYLGADGKRYVFPNSKTYLTWFPDFTMVVTITDTELGAKMLGGNVVYKPNSRLIKITTDPKVYWVGDSGMLHHVTTETIAKTLFGDNWAKIIDDVPDAFFTNYKTGAAIETASLPAYTEETTINKNIGLSNEEDPIYTGDGSISLSAAASGTSAKLTWTLTNMNSPKGFKVVKNTSGNPVYPGDSYHYLSDSETRSDTWTGMAAGTYHFRVCEYLGGACGEYSNDVAVTITGTGSGSEDGTISLSGSASGNTVNLNWTIAGMTSDNGFKIVKNTSGNPVYPGDAYHYLSSPDVRSDSWSELSAGTYHFRVCEYLGGSCGVYSNDLSVTVQ